MQLPSLSVVIPVYNEPNWIPRTVADLEAALDRSPFPDPEIVIVDDGSDEATRAALAELSTRTPLRVLRQENAGRFMARKAGIEAARGEMILMIDSRVSLDPAALEWVAGPVSEGRRVWNGHCLIDIDGNPFARFWDTVSHVAFADYLSDPRTTSFGPEEYDRFPKGTTHFLVPREYLLEAIDGFTTYYDDVRNSNDDTTLLRHVAERERIGISPHFASLYRSRTALRPFLKHVLHRGTVFFDGFGRPGSRFFGVVVAVFPATLAGLVLLIKRPLAALALLSASPLAAAGVAARYAPSRAHVWSFSLLAPIFAVVYTAGIWRGALLALQARRSR